MASSTTAEAAGVSVAERADEGLVQHIWWTHRSLEEEAVSPSVTAAETVAVCVADVTTAAEARVQSWLSSQSQRLRDWMALDPVSDRPARAQVVDSVREAIQWSTLQPSLTALRRALVRAWYEQRAEEAQQRADPLQASHPPASSSATVGKKAADVLDDRARRQLEHLEAQVYESFLSAVVKGIRRCCEGVAEGGIDGSQGPPQVTANALLCVCLDALLTDMATPSTSPPSAAATKKGGVPLGWAAGLIHQLELAEASVSSSSPPFPSVEARRLHRLQWFVCLCLRQSLRWSTSQPTEAARQQASFPLLITTARREVESVVRGVCSHLEESATSAALVDVRAAEKTCAAVLHAILDGTTGHGDTAFSAHSIRADESLSVPVSGWRHLTCITSPDDLVWMRDALVAPLVQTLANCRRHHDDVGATDGAKGSSTKEDLRDATVRAMFLCHRQPATLFLTTSFYPLISRLCVGTRDLASDTPASTAVALPAVLQAIDTFWARSSSVARGGEAVTIALVPDTVPIDKAGGSARADERVAYPESGSMQMNFIAACLARLTAVLATLGERVGSDDISTLASSSTALPSPPLSAAATLAACLAAQAPLTINRLLTWAMPKSSDMVTRGSVDASVTYKGVNSAARAQAFTETADVTTAVSAARVLFPRYSALCDVIEEALSFWQEHVGDTVSAVDPVTVVAAALSHVVETVFLSRESGQLAVAECLLFSSLVLTHADVEPQWQRVRRVLRLFLETPDSHTGAAAAGTQGDGKVAWDLILRRLHRWIVGERRYGLVLFFLPLFRALGLDLASAPEKSSQLCLAPRFPSSAEVAYLYELPKLFANGGGAVGEPGCHIATRAAEDSLAWWQQMVFGSLPALSDSESLVTSTTATATAATGTTTAALVIDILAEAGLVALVRAETLAASRAHTTSATTTAQFTPAAAVLFASQTTAHRALCVDACTAAFHAAVRLCAHVTHWRSAERECLHEHILRAMAHRLQADTPTSEAVAVERVRSCRIVGRGMPSPRTGSSEKAAVTPSRLVSLVYSAEAEVLANAHVFASIKSLLRACNLAYTKYIPTKPMLARRAHLEQRAADMLDEQPRLRESIYAAVREDVRELLAIEHARLVDEAQQRRAAELAERAKKAQEALEEAAAAARAAAEEAEKRSGEIGDEASPSTADVPDSAEEPTAEAHGDVVPEAPATPSGAHCDDEKVTSAAQNEEGDDEPPLVVPAPSRLSLSMAPQYFDALLSAVVARSCVSPADAMAAALVLCHAMEAVGAARLIEPRDLVRFLLRVTGMLAARLPQATPGEVTSLAVLLEVIGEVIVMPYKRYFLQTPADRTSVEREVTADSTDKQRAQCLVHALPDDEKEAFRLVRYYLADTTKAISQCLASRHTLGDTCAFLLHTRVRAVTGLVQTARDSVDAAVMARVRTVAAASVPLSPALEQLRHEAWAPLPSDLATPAATAEHLYTRHPPREAPRATSSTAAVKTTAAASTTTAATPSSSRRRQRRRSPSREAEKAASPAAKDGLSTSQRRRQTRKRKKEEARAAAETHTGGGSAKPTAPPAASSGRKRGRSPSEARGRRRRGEPSSQRSRR